jgi:hypothetical protein
LDLTGKCTIPSLFILKHMPSLVALGIDVDNFRETSPPVEMLNLQTLKICTPLGGEREALRVEALMHSLSMPMLHHLILSGFQDRAMTSFSSQGGGVVMFPVLHTLTITSGDADSNLSVIADLMNGLANIQHLIFVNAPRNNMLYLLSTTSLWSSLSTIEFGGNISDDALVTMLEHRLQIGYPIKRLILTGASSTPGCSTDFDSLRKYVEVGLFDWDAYYRSLDTGCKRVAQYPRGCHYSLPPL